MDPSNNKLRALTVGAIGVVFGDIGTSPLYAMKESFHASHGIPLNEATVLGILSVMFWAMMALVTVKYLVLMMRADNKGEGGILALTALAQRCFRTTSRGRWIVISLGIFGASMFYGDAIITPAMTVLSAIEGLNVATPAFEQFVMPISIGILVALFAIQRHGSATISKFFGPTMVVWFLVLVLLGLAANRTEAGHPACDQPLVQLAILHRTQGRGLDHARRSRVMRNRRRSALCRYGPLR